jgi:Tol biopolymer transport system component
MPFAASSLIRSSCFLTGMVRQFSLTQTGDSGDPLWSPDGSRIVYTNPALLYTVAADGSSPPETLNSGQWAPSPSSPVRNR